MIDHAKFIELLQQRFPAIAAGFNDIEEGLLHLETAAFAQSTDAALRSGDIRAVCDHFEFVDGLISDVAPNVMNAIYVSYLENIFIGVDDEFTRHAREVLPHRVRIALQELEDHWASLQRANYARRAGTPS